MAERPSPADVISEPFRRSIVGRALGWDADKLATETTLAVEVVETLEEPPKIARLITCRWCAGVWIAGGVVLARAGAPQAWEPVARGLALSASAVLIARLEES